MAESYYSNQDICIEALFEETNNVCICSQAHLKDYFYTRGIFNINPFDDECGVCYEEVPEDFCEDTSDSCQQALKDPSEDPEMHYEDGLDDEQELMKSMGLPTSFGKKLDESKKFYVFYSAGNSDNYEEYDYENEQRYDFDEYDQNGDCFNVKNSDSEKPYNVEICDNLKVKSSKNITNISANRNEVNKASKCENKISEFENFWTLHGDTICVNSWVEKYKEYIRPEFLKIFNEYDNVGEVIDLWSSSSCQNVQFDSETLQDSCVDDIVLNKPSANCDSELKNINDKFESMSFSDDVKIGSVDDGNRKYDNTNENAELEEISESLDSYELFSKNIMQFTTTDLENSESQLGYLEKGTESTSFPPIILDQLDNAYDDECNSNSKEFVTCPNKHNDYDADYEALKEIYPGIASNRKTKNPLFICTKSNEQYEAEVKSQTWEELWFAHCQEQFTYYSNFFSENSTKLYEYTEGYFSKCEYCGEIFCSNECTNPDNGMKMKVSGLLNKLRSNSHLKNNLSFSNEVLAYPVTHAAKEKTDESSLHSVDGPLQMDQIFSDDESPVELPIKRSYEVESEDEEPEEPEDMIKELGLVIRPTKCLKIQNKKRRLRRSQKKDLRTDFQTDNIETDNNKLEERENNDVDLNAENNEENRSKVAEEPHEAVKTEAEGNFDENMESEELASEENAEVLDEANDTPEIFDSYTNKKVLQKYWHQRYRLFHKFDEGIQLDEESWFSVTPERIAKHIAERCACGVIVDAFCGAGGNAIQFALVCYHVIAIDKDPKKIELAKHNAAVYGVTDYIDFIVGDYLDLAPYLKADGVFLSPPWGGPSYVNEAEYSIDKIEPDIYKVFEVSKKFTQNIALFVPKNTIVNQLVQLSGEGNRVEIEQNFLNKKVKTITAYYGEFVNQGSLKDESS